jgi:hypothetical protein
MYQGALGVHHAAVRGPDWAIILVATATVAAVFWEGWEAKTGTVHPRLKAAIGIATAFLSGISVEQGLAIFRSNASNQRWIFEVIIGLVFLGLSIHYTFNRKHPRSLFEWLNGRDDPPSMLDKKDA